MSLSQLLSTYFNLNVLIALAFIFLFVFSMSLRVTNKFVSSRSELRLHYFALAVLIALSCAQPLFPRHEFFKPAAKVWSAPSIESFGQEDRASDKSGYWSVPTPYGNSILRENALAQAGLIILLIWSLACVSFVVREFLKLKKIKDNSFLVRRLGSVRILVSAEIRIPFSFWLPFRAYVFIPAEILGRKEDFKIALSHELQHHRHNDTKWIYVIGALRLLCLLNPAIHYWSRWISEIQEFACDEILVDQGKVKSQAYARCLVEVAQSAINQKYVPACASGLAFLVERKILQRRISKMLNNKGRQLGRAINTVTGLIMASAMGAVALASNGLVQDRRITLTQANQMAAKARSESGFPVVVNDLVLKQLNRYIGTPEGREFMRDSLVRLENYRASISDSIKKYNVPAELMAIPIIESGYQNMSEEQSNTSMRSAGIWQFIPSTARNYGLRVDHMVDERLDVPQISDAALRYLLGNQLRFKDWPLAVLSFNMGESAVQKGMNATGTRDAWTLVRNGYEGDRDYLPKVMAAILIMKNPDSVR